MIGNFYLGLVREGPVSIKLANGDTVEPSPPQWGIDIKCGKGKIRYIFLF